MYQIYINQTELIITESLDNAFLNYQSVDYEDFDFVSFYNRVKDVPQAGSFVLSTSNARQVFKKIKRSLTFIKAAGGLVRNEENKYLFIFRNGKWDLPKGKIDPGEKTKKAAVREVQEECGIKVDHLDEKLCKTYHVYEMGRRTVLKKTTWYRMRANDQPHLIPQREEGITEARWLSPGDFSMVKQNTYPMIRDVIGRIEV